jgi:transposase
VTWHYFSASAANTAKRKSVIVAFDEESLSSSEIAARVGCNRSSVSGLRKRKHETGDVRRKPGTGLRRVRTEL